jgi:hypothetical protein
VIASHNGDFESAAIDYPLALCAAVGLVADILERTGLRHQPGHDGGFPFERPSQQAAATWFFATPAIDGCTDRSFCGSYDSGPKPEVLQKSSAPHENARIRRAPARRVYGRCTLAGLIGGAEVT